MPSPSQVCRDGDASLNQQEHVQELIERAQLALPNAQFTYSHCVNCGEPIPEGRRRALAGVKTCIACAER